MLDEIKKRTRDLFRPGARSDERAKRRAEAADKARKIVVATAEDVLLCSQTDYATILRDRWRQELDKGLDALEAANDFQKGRLSALRHVLRAWDQDIEEAKRVLNGEN